MKWTRRRLLRAGGAAMGLSAAGLGGAPARAQSKDTAGDAARAARRVALTNLHTGESLDVEYFRGGDYVPAAFTELRRLLRDFRNGEQHDIDPKLMDIVHAAARQAGVDPVFSVISGYRSPRTNEALRERSAGVARHSLHLEGRAIDVRHAGIDCAELASTGLGLALGGVGYYRQSDFVHLDTGAVRSWRG